MRFGNSVRLEEVPESLEGEESFSTVNEEQGVFLYNGDISGDQAFLLEDIESTAEQTEAYRVTPVEKTEIDLENAAERLGSAEGYEIDESPQIYLEASGESRDIETSTLYQEDDHPMFHVREMVETYRQRTGEGLEHSPSQPPEGSWIEQGI